MGKHRKPRNFFAWGVLTAATVGAFSIGFFPTMANAAPEGSIFVESDCLDDWYVNGDETDRLPAQTELGLEFEATDLVHHEASILLKDLVPGSYVANPEPDQPSFFSVEVRDTNGNYGTLRWNGTVWSITIGTGGDATTGTFTDVNPVTLLTDKRSKWGTANFDTSTTTVISFGVGYTQNPPGTIKTLVSSVTFQGEKFNLDCAPEETPSPSPSVTTPAPTNTVSPAVTRSPVVAGGPSLPVTGSKMPYLIGAGVVVVVAGSLLAFAARTRRVRVETPNDDL